MTRKRAGLIAAVVASVGALIPTGLILAMRADHNSQGELIDPMTGQWDVGHALETSAIVFLPCFAVLFAIFYVITRWWHEGAEPL